MKKRIFTGVFALLALASCGGGETHSHEEDIHAGEAAHGASDEHTVLRMKLCWHPRKRKRRV